jgi:hypothetical protein
MWIGLDWMTWSSLVTNVVMWIRSSLILSMVINVNTRNILLTLICRKVDILFLGLQGLLAKVTSKGWDQYCKKSEIANGANCRFYNS